MHRTVNHLSELQSYLRLAAGRPVNQGLELLQTWHNTLLLVLARLRGHFWAARLAEHWGLKWTLTILSARQGLVQLSSPRSERPVWSLTDPRLCCSSRSVPLSALRPRAGAASQTVRAAGVGWASPLACIADAVASCLGAGLLPSSLLATLTLYPASCATGGPTVLLPGLESKARCSLETVGG